jgi:hypothetical protein
MLLHKSCRFLVLPFLLFPLPLHSLAPAGEPAKAADFPWVIDFRHAPVWWQTSICLPDDWQKTLVGKEGTLLVDYPGKFSGFKTRIGLDLGANTSWLRQELVSPRIPIVRTFKRQGSISISEEAFAVPPSLGGPEKTGPATLVERTDSGSTQRNWAQPKIPCDPAFANIAVTMGGSVGYRIRASKDGRYTVVLGFCEGWHDKPGQRLLDVKIEGRTRKTIDMIADHGRNVPALFPFEARDDNGDGWIEVTIAAAEKAIDKNTILNVLWIFQDGAPPMDELLRGVSSRPALVHLDCGAFRSFGLPRHDVILAQLRNTGEKPAQVAPRVTIDSELSITARGTKDSPLLEFGDGTLVHFTHPIEVVSRTKEKWVLRFKPLSIPAGQETCLALGVSHGAGSVSPATLPPRNLAEALEFRKAAEAYWQRLDLPFNRLEVPDGGVQALLDSSIRNIYQAREIKNGLPAFQVGPTCYRGLWVVDGSFLMEAIAFLGRAEEARNGIRYLLSFQQKNGAIMLIDGHWKETGIALWAVTRHARLTGDKAWLKSVWPQIQRGVAYIKTMRQKASADPKSLTAGLIPEGFSDGGLGGINPEYTNVYWTLTGMQAAIEAAHWLGKIADAGAWQQEYDDFMAAFRKATRRDLQTDALGNRYLPISMRKGQKLSPQKAQWAFLHALFPGKVFTPDDPLVVGNLAMLRAAECQGLVRDTGWIGEGVWNYFGSFYAHGWLWTGQGQKAAQTLYSFGNHASPLLVWREEQMPTGKGDQICGDMPHNWASAEFIRLVRHLLVLERGNDLHLFEGLPRAWIQAGKKIRVQGVATEFGPISLELAISADRKQAFLTLDPPARTPPRNIVVHLSGWSGRQGVLKLPAGKSEKPIAINIE